MLASSAEGIQLHSRGSHSDTHTFVAAEVHSQQRGLPRLLGCDWSFIELLFYAYFTPLTLTHTHICQLVWSFTYLPNQGHCLFFSFLPSSSPPLPLSHSSPPVPRANELHNMKTASQRKRTERQGGGRERERERDWNSADVWLMGVRCQGWPLIFAGWMRCSKTTENSTHSQNCLSHTRRLLYNGLTEWQRRGALWNAVQSTPNPSVMF